MPALLLAQAKQLPRPRTSPEPLVSKTDNRMPAKLHFIYWRSIWSLSKHIEKRQKMKFNSTVFILACVHFGVGCTAPPLPSDSDTNKTNLTAGVAQREIRKGMSGGEVATVLGSPNIVTSGPEGTEVWIYDQMSTRVEASSAGTGVWFIIGVTNQNTGAVKSSQSTLTIVVKFDAAKKVTDVAYHQSKF